MPTTTAPASSAAPAAAVPPSTPTPSATPPVTPAAPPVDKIGSAKKEGDPAHRLFQRLSNNAPEAKDEPVFPGDKPAKPVAEVPKPKPETVAPEKPIKVSKKTAKRPELPVTPAAPVAEVPAAPAKVEPTDANWKESLLEEERAALDDAEFAEKQFPEHKGLGDRMAKFFRAHKKFLEDHPDVEDNDPEYLKVLAMRPEIGVRDRRKISDTRAAMEAKKSFEPEIEDLRHELFVRDEEPKIRAERSRLFNELADTAIPEEMRKVYKEKGLAELQKNYGDELEVAKEIINAVADDAEELLRITKTHPKTGRPLAKVAAEPNDPKFVQHERLAKLVDDVCEDFKNTATEKEQVRDGKWFVTREEWARIPAHARSQYWTFTNSEQHVREMLNRAKRWVPGVIEGAIKRRQEALESRGYRRVRDTGAPVVAATPPTPVSAPSSPRPSPMPSPTAPAAVAETRGSALAKRLQAGG